MATRPTPVDPAPSRSYAFEPEFLGHPPRQLPESLDRRPYATRQRAKAIAFGCSGAVCLLAWQAPGVDVLARYLVPLGYLEWIGLGAFVLAAASYAPLAARSGPFRYVRDGLPLAVRVLELLKAPTAVVNGVPSAFAFVANVGFRHPENGELRQLQVRSDDFSAARKDAYDARFKVGDDVTGVYFPGRLEKTLKLYAFLELSPDVNLRPSAARPQDPPWKVALGVAALLTFFIILFANVYAYGRYEPIGFEFRSAAVPMALGGLLLGGGLLAFLYWSHSREQERLAERARKAQATGGAIETATPFLGRGIQAWVLRVVMFLGAPLLGALTTLCWCFMANAWLDRSPVQRVPASVLGMTMTTHAFLFREYELEYRLEGGSEKRKLLTTPEHLFSLVDRRTVAHVREGRFGWRWVETIVAE
jgi:hypothetical protein